MRWNDYRDWWVEVSLNALASEWSWLGVNIDDPGEAMLIDPEGLAAATWSVGRADARLFDAALQWSRTNSRHFDRTRLKALLRVVDAETAAVGCAWWEFMSDGLGPPPDGPEEREPVELFWRPGAPSVTTSSDERFARHGLRRGRVGVAEHVGAVAKPRMEAPANARLTLRSLMGTNARAEIVALLGSRGARSTAWLARESLYSRRSVQLVVNDFQQAGFVELDGDVIPAGPFDELSRLFGLTVTGFASGAARARILDAYWTATTEIVDQSLEGYAAFSRFNDALVAADEILRTHEYHVTRPRTPARELEELTATAEQHIRTILGLR